MSDTKQSATEAVEAVHVELDLPAGLVRAYDALVEDGIYPNRANALMHGLVQSWQHNQGSFHTLRVDLDCGRKSDDVEPTPQEASEKDHD